MIRALLASAVLLLASPAVAAAEPIEEFIGWCIDTDGNAAAAGARAEQAGWHKLPSEIFGEDEFFQDPSVYMNIDPFGAAAAGQGVPPEMRFLMTGWGMDGFDMKGARMDMCGLVVETGDFAALQSQLADHFGFAPGMVSGEAVWVYSREGRTLRSEAALLDTDKDPMTVLQGRKIFFVGATEEGEGSVMLIMGAIRSAP